MTDGVFIAMPVYRGSDVIEETLRSILAQTYENFHVVMSVDGSDDPTIEVCREYEDDPRIDVFVQESRLGWPGNLNWLVQRCDREYFCYWQQDDLASTGYLESLSKELAARPDAAIAYTDVQWFGAKFDRDSTPGIEGPPLSRVMQNIEAIRFEPLRGLMRASMLPSRPDAIPVTEDESCQEEFVFMTEMASAGAFVRVDTAMYFKRLHGSNVFARWAKFPDWRRRRGWISMGSGMYEIARRIASPEEEPRILTQILDRLAVRRHGRGHFYLPSQETREIRRFTHDFISYSEVRLDNLHSPEDQPRPLERPVHQDILAAVQAESEAATRRLELGDWLSTRGSLHVDPSSTDASAILGYGWSTPEDWGVWTDGGFATLQLPTKAGSKLRIELTGRQFPDWTPMDLGYQLDRGSVDYVTLEPGHSMELVIEVSPQCDGVGVLQLHLPEATSPAELGVSADTRAIGLGLTSLQITES